MKLLGWMHHKLWKNTRDFTTAKSSLNDQEFFSESTFSPRCEYKSSRLSKKDCKSSSEFEQREAEEDLEDKDLVFHGFLTIGTLGSEQIINNSETPTFPTFLEDIAEEEADVTEIDLKLINDKLRNFFESEAEEKGSDESSTRNSQVNIITLSGNPMEETNSEENERMICPLQGYLYGSSIEISEATTAQNKEKGSLADLFDREKTAEETSKKYGRREEMPLQAKEKAKPVKHRIMKILKKLQSSSKSNSTSTKETSVFSKKRVSKVIKMFQRKIHPESYATEPELPSSKNYKTNDALNYCKYIERELKHQDQDTCKLQEERQGYKNNSKLPKNMLPGSASRGNREHWITTDANYLVLELE